MIDSTVAVPNKRFGFFIPDVEKLMDGLLQILDAEECAPTDTLA
jgi:hypothetical protein